MSRAQSASQPRLAAFVGLFCLAGLVACSPSERAIESDVVYEPPWYKAICPVEAMNRIQENLAGLPPGPSDFEQMWIAWLFLGIYAAVVVFKLKGFLKTTEAVA